MQRLRIRFSRGDDVKFISHMDIMRLWQRALRRANIPLTYSEGFNPHPHLSLAAPLAVGVTSEAELMDIFCARPISAHSFISTLKCQLPTGIEVHQAFPVAPNVPSLQSQVRFAEYSVVMVTDKEKSVIEAALDSLLSLERLPWQHQRDTGMHKYDLRALIDDLWVVSAQSGSCTLGMRLRCDGSGAGRPEQVTIAMGFSSLPQSIHRTRLILEAQ